MGGLRKRECFGANRLQRNNGASLFFERMGVFIIKAFRQNLVNLFWPMGSNTLWARIKDILQTEIF